ncbi:neurotransmitter-gated ion-channel ligand-binding protein [Rhizobium sp. TRM95796]|uniref:neurotransmitter-gated ion-channel ligand-binding protein n=1 Tax=Rhizobium sp. TRM95796 TaxID=2979862 RepID=UPI0021E90EB6|nr:neurotransmitter-gated ion-channel ligand-binding protein [Rhizobium sp. TRM95796]MCV3766355.1 neurotransmitter-gated ion-channel ligand-binding protein [Rhizobium sp. TRM95796]
MIRLGTLVSLLLLLTCLAPHAFAAAPPPSLPGRVHLPIETHLSVRLLNITRLEETKGEISARVEYTQGWKDPNQAFDPLAAGVYRHDYFGEEAEAKIAAIWTPDVTIANQIDEPRSRSVALSISADGTMSLIRQLDADFRISVDLAAFPFDRQNIDFVFTAPRYSASDLIFVVDDRDREISAIADQISISDWRPERLSFALTQFYGWNAKPFVRATVTATVSREWPRYLLRIFIPFAAVVSVSLFILWAPDKVKVDHAGITYSALLALAALSFTFESSFPGSMSVNSPIAFMISLGYFYLVLTLLVHLGLQHAEFPAARRNAYLIEEIHRSVRFTLPAIFTLICICSVVRSLS